jgi:hypothetical protein
MCRWQISADVAFMTILRFFCAVSVRARSMCTCSVRIPWFPQIQFRSEPSRWPSRPSRLSAWEAGELRAREAPSECSDSSYGVENA